MSKCQCEKEIPACCCQESAAAPVARVAVLFLMSAVIMYFFGNFQRSAVPGPIFDQLQSEFNTKAVTITSLASIFLYMYSAMQLLIGLLTDRYSGCRVLATGCIFFSIGSVLFAFSGNVPMLYIGRLITGLGASTIYLSMIKEIDRLFPKTFTKVLGVTMLVGCLGSFFSNIPFTFVSNLLDGFGGRAGWRNTHLIFGLLITINSVFLLAFFSRMKKPPIAPGKLFSSKPYKITFTNPYMLRMLGCGPFLYAVYNVFMVVIGKKLLEDRGGLSANTAALVVSLMPVFAALCQLLPGALENRLNKRRKGFFFVQICIGWVSTAIILGGLYCPQAIGAWMMVAGLVFLACAGGMTPLTTGLLREINSPDSVGVSLSSHNCCTFTLVGIFGNIGGLIMDKVGAGKILLKPVIKAGGSVEIVKVYPTASYAVFFVFLLVLMTFAVWNAAHMPETNGRNIYKKKED